MSHSDIPIQTLILGTGNAKKGRELRMLLQPLGLDLKTLADIPNAISVDETGTTFIENARLKACQQAVHLGQWTVGEDSGLVVPALNGQPGVYSARFSGPHATDESNNVLLLERMKELKGEARGAYYICTIALSDPNGQIVTEATGQCWGRIIENRRGSGGFGYDPMFEIPEYHQTFAELGDQVKSVLSHRARALIHFRDALKKLISQ